MDPQGPSESLHRVMRGGLADVVTALLHIAAQTKDYCPLVFLGFHGGLGFRLLRVDNCVITIQDLVFDYPLAVGRCANVRASIYTKGDLLFWLSSRPGWVYTTPLPPRLTPGIGSVDMTGV